MPSRKGSPNKRTLYRQLSQAVVTGGVAPLEVMLENMRFYHDEADKILTKLIQGLKEPSEKTVVLLAKLMDVKARAEACAADAAPYCHPRLQAVNITGKVEHQLPDDMSPLEAVEEIKRRGLPPPPLLLEDNERPLDS